MESHASLLHGVKHAVMTRVYIHIPPAMFIQHLAPDDMISLISQNSQQINTEENCTCAEMLHCVNVSSARV